MAPGLERHAYSACPASASRRDPLQTLCPPFSHVRDQGQAKGPAQAGVGASHVRQAQGMAAQQGLGSVPVLLWEDIGVGAEDRESGQDSVEIRFSKC